jgi:L-ribulose-5-phosphate 3-epimerase
MISRRAFVQAAIAGATRPLLAAAPAAPKIGVVDTVFRMPGDPGAIRMARNLGLAAVQVSLGRSVDGKTLPLEDPQLQQAWLAASKQARIPINSPYLDMLHADCLKDNPNGPMWVRKGIEITRTFHAQVLMLVFFGRCQVTERADLDRAIAVLRELTPEAERAGVILGFENSISAADNRYAFDRVKSKAFQVFYDVGNSTNYGFDPPTEIRALGRERICMFHIKDRGYLGEGQVNVSEVLRAIDDIGFEGYVNLETSSPSGDVEADARRNLEYLRKAMAR